MSAENAKTERVSIERDGAAAARAALEHVIGDGGIAVFPADGLYGLACDPLNESAVDRIQSLKGRDEAKPSAVMYFTPLVMRELIGEMGARTQEAVATLLPGPVTLVIANPVERYPLACREDPGRLGVRLIGGPLAATRVVVLQTSANRSGEPAASRFADVDPAILSAVELSIDGGELSGKPSTVVDLSEVDSGGDWSVLREGAIDRVELERTMAGV
ncbi:MAG: L-threonylcarbamoyladenylate synthase [Solirubrobacterales bacterium]